MTAPLTVGDVTEAEVIELITAAAAHYDQPGVRTLVPNGDDAAVLHSAAAQVITTDTSVEEFDFRTDWSAPDHIGWKTVVQNIADVCAMAAQPHSLTLTLGLPAQTPLAWVRGFASGCAAACAKYRVNVIGGDISASSTLFVSITAVGSVETPVTRSGAQPGDQLIITGPVGRSAAGLKLLASGVAPADVPPELFHAHVRPSPDVVNAAQILRGVAHAMIDVSDGLLRDAHRVACASDVAIIVDDSFLAAATAAILDQSDDLQHATAQECVLTGGEEHVLLAAVPAQWPVPTEWLRVGHVGHYEPGTNHRVWLDDRPYHGPLGFDHFKPTA